jgi:ketosteroid isomerase-like protein
MLILRLTAAALLLAVTTLRGQTPGLDSASAAGVAQLLVRFDATASAAGRLDAAARSALFTDDATSLNAWGGRVDGRASVDSMWRRLYASSTFDSSRIELLDRRQRVLAPGLVLVDHLECLTGQRGPNSGRELPPRATHITLVLRREPDSQWRIVYYRAGDLREFAQRAPACDRFRKQPTPAR